MDRKMTVAAAVKRVPAAQQKGKISKPKTIASKVKPKGVTAKRLKPGGAKVKVKPAPHVEPGYSLYSTTSEDSVAIDNDTSLEVLKLLRERKKEGKIKGTKASGGKTPFNNRLSSSTPDPERLSLDKNTAEIYQMIPEKDTSSTLWKEKLADGNNQLQNPGLVASVTPSFVFEGSTLQGFVGNTGNPGMQYVQQGIMGIDTVSGIRAQSFPFGNCEFYDSHKNYYRTEGNVPVLTASQGFIPTQEPLSEMHNELFGRESDSGTLRAYIPTDSMGFMPSQGSIPEREIKGNPPSSKGDKSASTVTPNTSRSGYITLPRPQGGQSAVPGQGTQPIMTQENGLYQIRAQNPQAATDKNRLQNLEKYITGEVVYPTPVSNKGGSQNSDGSYLQSTDLPERDGTVTESTLQPVVPALDLHETLSSISGSSSHTVETPVSQRTLGNNSETPRSPATPKNSSGSGSNKSVHFSAKKDSVEENSLKGDSSDPKEIKTTETQTDSQSFSSVAMHSGISGQSSNVPAHVLIPTGQGHVLFGQGGIIQQIPGGVQVAGTTLQKSGISDQSSVQTSSSGVVPNPWSQVKTDAGLKKLRYFLKELRECGKINKDVEIGRLVKEIEKTLETIPQLKSTFSLQAEIDLAIQPLRNENAQLRRRLRLVGQYTKEAEAEKQEKEKGQGHVDFETLQLQASNTALKRQLNEEKERLVKMAAEVTDAHAKLQKLQTEKNKLVASLSEKQTTELQVRQECLSDTQKLRGEVEKLHRQIQASQITHQAVERENHILQITIQQRDAEIQRQQEMIEAIKDSVCQLLQELESSRAGADKSYLSNNSFSLQRILNILDKEHGIRQNRSIRSDPGSKVESSRAPRPRLTAEVLATHNERVHRQNGIGEEIRGSTSDTEVDFMEREENIRKKSPKIRRRSISGDGEYCRDFHQTRHVRYGVSENYDHTDPRGHLRERMAYTETVQRMCRDNLGGYGHQGNDKFLKRGQHHDNRSDYDQSAVESRYSVTDYFRKYSSQKSGAISCERSVSGNRGQLRNVSFQEHWGMEDRNHRRSLSQPVGHVFTSRTLKTPLPHRTLGLNDAKSKSKSPQEKLFTGTALDNSISAIDDDNISSVSEKTTSRSTSSTVDEKNFRKGIATLDANILKLQLALQRTKNMLD